VPVIRRRSIRAPIPIESLWYPRIPMHVLFVSEDEDAKLNKPQNWVAILHVVTKAVV
jgi:hypothetical protein